MNGTKNIIIDPFLKNNPKATTTEVTPDIIAITHGHADHMGDTTTIAKKHHCKIVAIHEIAKYLATCNIECEGMNKGGTIAIEKINFTMTEAIHSASIEEAEPHFDGGCPAGFIIEDNNTRIYHAGDTALFRDMQLIGELYKPQIAMLPMGGRYTMGPREAAIATSWLQPEIAIPMHYNTFPAIKQSPREFKELIARECNTKVVIMEPGETIEYQNPKNPKNL
ncbi:metal-dependent hydrolase [Methanosarcinales archaeon ex4484_138]|nr:MAG: metal-dependent hydrolase [Methanosarcinales archaeon ex4484_138]